MLDSDTKRRIDSARQILVGKVPDPKGQVEQITTALIYKFMDDMDKEAQELGGEVKFFTGEYEKYAWSRLMDVRLGGQARLNLYTEALAQLWQNKNLPVLFQQIFKSSFLPFRDPETLNLFLKEINGFVYDHSERLGDSYEYLLSVLGTQGDAGQFRTPRHIIDFIVEAVNPTKDDTILDPACGTAGFLISAYKHILKANTKHKSGDALTPEEKRSLMGRFTGYDISPDMVRLSLVNMYLHGFPLPNIVEYDTLGQQERWDDSFNVILANPPFMTPKGGVMPHKRFSVQASRSEVLFVDYIADHLTPNGRAGVIVPEGIIFQSGKAYKQLRKMLVEGYLYAVISLPAGAFNPYSGVKTSVLLMDKNIAKRSREIAFVKVSNDGFDLGAQRRVIAKNDLPQALEILKTWKEGKKIESPLVVYVEKTKIAENGDFNLSGDRYRVGTDYSNAKWPMMELGEICEIIAGQSPAGKSYNKTGEGMPFYQGKTEFSDIFLGAPTTWTTQITKMAEAGDILMSVRAPVGPINVATQKICIGRGLAVIRPVKADKWFLFHVLRNIQDSIKGNGGAVFDSISKTQIGKIKIPLPPLEVQQQIVEELDGYQKIISGARQVVENWKPRIEMEEGWERVELGDVVDIFNGSTPKRTEPAYWEKGTIPWFTIDDVREQGRFISNTRQKITEKGFEESSVKLLPKNTVLLCCTASVGEYAYAEIELTTNQQFNGLVIKKGAKNKLIPKFLFWYSTSLKNELERMSGKATFSFVSIGTLKNFLIPLPPLEIQKQIVEKIEVERALVDAAKKLVGIYEGKMKERIGRVWGEEK